MKKLTLYHGSGLVVQKPDVLYGKKNNDYGQGFYCSESAELAREWACPREKDGILNRYCLETDGMRVFHLKGESEEALLIWISVLLSNRKLNLDTENARASARFLQSRYLMSLETADLVIGYRADDSYFDYAESFVNNGISVEQLAMAMRLGKLGEQIVLKSKFAFSHLHYEGFENAEKDKYYILRKARNEEANQLYPRMLEEESDGLYIQDIMRGGISNDDPRIPRNLSASCPGSPWGCV